MLLPADSSLIHLCARPASYHIEPAAAAWHSTSRASVLLHRSTLTRVVQPPVVGLVDRIEHSAGGREGRKAEISGP